MGNSPSTCCAFRLPFVEVASMETQPNASFCRMLSYYFCPYFRFRSFSFLSIVLTLLGLIIPQFLFEPTLQEKLFPYPFIPSVYLQPLEAKYANHFSLYKSFTTLFFHLYYTHWLGNMLGVVLIMFTMEFCWAPSVFFMLIGSIASYTYYCLIIDNMLMGFSGVIACALGLFVGMFVGNWRHITKYYPALITLWAINSLFVFLLLFSSDSRSTIIHFISLGLGVIYGIGWIPKLNPSSQEALTGHLCKLLSILLTILPFILIFSFPVQEGVPLDPQLLAFRQL